MSGTTTLYLTTDTGTRLAAPINGFLEGAFLRSLNRIGTFSLLLPGTFDATLVERADRMIQVWRSPEGGRRSLWRAYFIRGWREYRQGRADRLLIWGVDTLDLLRRRIVATYAGSASASMTDYADDMIKQVVRDALLDSDPATDAGSRAWDDLSVAGDLSDGPEITKSFAWKPLLLPSGGGVLPSLAAAAREAGTEVFFDVAVETVTATSITFVFRTAVNQPGTDRTDPTLKTYALFSERAETLRDPYYEEDWTEEQNYIYSGGQNTEDDRTIEQVYDATRYGRSQWGRCEGFADARTQSAANGVREAGRAALAAGRPQIRAGGMAKDTPALRYGLDWDLGDRVAVKARGRTFDALIETDSLILKRGEGEAVRAKLAYRA